MLRNMWRLAGGTAWGRAAPHEGQSSKAQAWLKEYMSFTLPSVSLEALGESCFAQTAVTPDADPSPHAAQQDEQPGEASPESVLPRDKTSGRVLKLDSLFKGIYTGAAPSSDTPVASSQASLKLPSHESASKLPPRPPSTPGSDRYYAGGKRASAEKALHRATQSEKGLSKSSSWHADRGISGGAAAGTSAGSGISLTARNLVLKEKMEKKEKEKSQTKKHAMASRPESVAMVGIMDEEELEALAGEKFNSDWRILTVKCLKHICTLLFVHDYPGTCVILATLEAESVKACGCMLQRSSEMRCQSYQCTMIWSWCYEPLR